MRLDSLSSWISPRNAFWSAADDDFLRQRVIESGLCISTNLLESIARGLRRHVFCVASRFQMVINVLHVHQPNAAELHLAWTQRLAQMRPEGSILQLEQRGVEPKGSVFTAAEDSLLLWTANNCGDDLGEIHFRFTERQLERARRWYEEQSAVGSDKGRAAGALVPFSACGTLKSKEQIKKRLPRLRQQQWRRGVLSGLIDGTVSSPFCSMGGVKQPATVSDECQTLDAQGYVILSIAEKLSHRGLLFESHILFREISVHFFGGSIPPHSLQQSSASKAKRSIATVIRNDEQRRKRQRDEVCPPGNDVAQGSPIIAEAESSQRFDTVLKHVARLYPRVECRTSSWEMHVVAVITKLFLGCPDARDEDIITAALFPPQDVRWERICARRLGELGAKIPPGALQRNDMV
jgi:hypothetical protein